jgi:hypothetical protein
MGWRRETLVLLAWLALTLGACALVATRGDVSAGLALCGPAIGEGSVGPRPSFGPCGDALITIVLFGAVLAIGGVATLVAAARWIRSRQRGRR